MTTLLVDQMADVAEEFSSGDLVPEDAFWLDHTQSGPPNW